MTASINIFNLPQVVTLTLGGDSTGATLMNYPVNRTDFKLIKGMTNEIMFFVKDTDRHPVTVANLANAGIVDVRIVITNPFNECLLLGSTDSILTTYVTNVTTTTTTLSNNTVIVSNTTVIYSNTVTEPSGPTTNTPIVVSSVGPGTYTVPDNTVNAIVIELWGPGGAGTLSAESGAAGGAYAKKTISVSEGDSFPYYVGNSAGAEQATYWGNPNPNLALFGAYGGASVANNVIDVSFAFGAPFGEYDVGYVGGAPITDVTTGQASAWSGGPGSTNPAAMNESTIEGGGQSNGVVGTTPGGGAPANTNGDSVATLFGGVGQIRITQIIDPNVVANSTSNSGSDSNSMSNSNTIVSNTVTITNSVSSTVTYTSNSISLDASVLTPPPGIDPAKGVWMLRLKATDIADWPTGYLRYGVICDRIGGDQVMLYTDRAGGPYGTLEVLKGPFPTPKETTVILPEDCITLGYSLYSGAQLGSAQAGNISGVHGGVIHLTSFRGSVTVQASLENEVPVNDADWFPANVISATMGSISGGTITYNTPTDGAIYIEAVGNYMWVRFIVHTDIMTPGASWSSIDYRND